MANISGTDTFSNGSDELPAPETEELGFELNDPSATDAEGMNFRRSRPLEKPAETSRVPRAELSTTMVLPPNGDDDNLCVAPDRAAKSENADAERGGSESPQAVKLRFELHLRERKAPVIEEWLGDLAEPGCTELLAMLLVAELRFRVKNGEQPTLNSYRNRFPNRENLLRSIYLQNVCPPRIGRFRVQRFLGEGNFGRVYLGKDERLDRLVALKVPRAEKLSGSLDRDRFVQEARLAARVKHHGIITVYQVDYDDEFGVFVALEYIEGMSLSTLIRKERLAPERAAEIMALAADAVSYAHEKGLVHRDLKPSNILLDSRGRPFIADFGLAVHESDRWPIQGEVAGTPAYMSPEQVRGESHRLDGRTDIWSLGVILYRMLTNHPPFEGSSTTEVFDEILGREPVPPRQRDRLVSRELERICLKCLSKRMTDRYATAADLVDDLRNWLLTEESATKDSDRPDRPLIGHEGMQGSRTDQASGESTLNNPVRIRPRGLRAFDFDDREYFLKLLPGPRDRDGMPESLRFWKVRIEPDGRKTPFMVGLLCGPSGSGKTSMIRAGLLCRLSDNLYPVYVEASPTGTEAKLLDGLRRVPEAAADAPTLRDAIAAFRGGSLSASGRKVLIVIDQLEQWLHAHPECESVECELTEAIRQCDGVHIQCLLLVRDEFAMAAARFMRALEIRLVESQNFATVDLFDRHHASKVLRAFGVAYKRFDEHERGPHDRFIEQAVSDLSEDGKVAPVRLALFAQMLKDKPWTAATLRNVGGLEGIGATFLEESLAGPLANPEHRLHLPAARRVLTMLLPEGPADIKGHMRSYQELLDASRYTRKPRDFDTLLEILGTELRLITPTDPVGAEQPETLTSAGPVDRYYQITHDYLVPSLRDWLTRKERETMRGRMAHRLAERTVEWSARRSKRYLPALWEWLGIQLLTHPSRRSPAERRMMRSATLYHATRVGALAALLLVLSLVVRDRLAVSWARSAIRELQTGDPGNVPRLIRELEWLRPWADPQLRSTESDPRSNPRDRVRARLALLPVDPSQADNLMDPLLEGDPSDFLLIRNALSSATTRSTLTTRLRAVLLAEREPADRRFRAGMALGGVIDQTRISNDANLIESAPRLVNHLIDDLLTHPDRYNTWLAALQPIGPLLRPNLEVVFRDPNGSDGVRSMAANILANYANDDVNTLAKLLLDANPRQFPIILRKLDKSKVQVIPALREMIAISAADLSSQEARNQLASQQANAAIGLLHLGEAPAVWPLLEHRPDPLVRTYLIDRLAKLTPDPLLLLERFNVEQNASVRAALLLIIGRIPFDQRSASWYPLAARRVPEVFRGDPDPGVHSAAEWVKRQWRLEEPSPLTDQREASDGKSWYITRSGHTMAMIPGPATYRMGRGQLDKIRDEDEEPHVRRISRSFGLSTLEVSAEQYLRFRREVSLEQFPDANPKRFPNDYSSDLHGPINIVFWLDAIAYCRWLSEQEQIPEDQMCYPKLSEIRIGMKPYPDYLQRTGYRLPTEAEWEYAARAGACTSRFFGDDDAMLPAYAWFIKNSTGTSRPCGLLLPNNYGLFDVMGNLREWCYDAYQKNLKDGTDQEDPAAIDRAKTRVARGGTYSDDPNIIRIANRYYTLPTDEAYSMGFRIARTWPRSR